MESKNIDQIRNILTQWLDSLTTNSNKNIIAFPKSNATSPDPIDRASAQSEMDYTVNKIYRDGLNKDNILNALKKIDDGDYGICEACEEKIPIKRLKAIPDARYCITCQSEFENDLIVA
jgi:DnaK suppressor protein